MASLANRSSNRSTNIAFAIFALAMGGFAIGTTEFAAMGLLPQIADGMRVSEPRAGYLISTYALGVVVGAPLLAGLGAKWPRKTMLIALMIAFAVGNVLSVIAPTFGLLFVSRFLADPACRDSRIRWRLRGLCLYRANRNERDGSE